MFFVYSLGQNWKIKDKKAFSAQNYLVQIQFYLAMILHFKGDRAYCEPIFTATCTLFHDIQAS